MVKCHGRLYTNDPKKHNTQQAKEQNHTTNLFSKEKNLDI
jgi:hypothetical protein